MRAPRILTLLCALAAGLSFALAQQTTTTPVFIVLTDPTGAGAGSANVRIVPGPDPSPKMETDSKGRLALQLKPGGYAIFASLQGFKKIAKHFDVKATQDAQTFSFVFELLPDSGPVMVSPAASPHDLAVFVYPYHAAVGYSLAELKAMAHITVTIHNSHTDADETYSGVRLAELLAKLGAPLGKELRGEAMDAYIVAAGSDGYSAVLALAEVDPDFHPGEVIVADAMNDKPLDARSGPLKLVVSEDKRPARSVRNLISIELKSAQ